jgi:hypothetical protein
LGQSLEYHLIFEPPYDLVQEFKGVEHFQDTRKFVLQIIEMLQPLVKKWNATYKCVIHVGIIIASLELPCKTNYL